MTTSHQLPGLLPPSPLALRPRAFPGLLLVGMFLLGITGCGGGAQEGGADWPRAQGQPLTGKLNCPAPTLDFGLVHEGRLLEATFDLKVQAEGEFTIQNVRADCGCTATAMKRAPGGDLGALEDYLPEMPLRSGDILRLTVDYDTRGKGGQTRREITLYADIPGGRAIVSLEADIQPWLLAEPREVIVGRMGREEVRQEHLRVHSVAGAAFALEHQRRGVPDALKLELTPIDAEADGRASEWDVLVTLGPDMPEGTHNYPLYLVSDHVLATDSSSGQQGEVPRASTTPQLMLEVVGLYSVEPGSFSFQQVDGSRTVASTVHLRCFDPDFEGQTPTARLEIPESPNGPEEGVDPQALLETARLDIRANPAGGWDVQLLLEGLAPEVGKRFLALVLLDTGHPDRGVVEIPVIGFRASGGGF